MPNKKKSSVTNDVVLNNYGKLPRCSVLLERLKLHTPPTNFQDFQNSCRKRNCVRSPSDDDDAPAPKKTIAENFCALDAPFCSDSSSILSSDGQSYRATKSKSPLTPGWGEKDASPLWRPRPLHPPRPAVSSVRPTRQTDRRFRQAQYHTNEWSTVDDDDVVAQENANNAIENNFSNTLPSNVGLSCPNKAMIGPSCSDKAVVESSYLNSSEFLPPCEIGPSPRDCVSHYAGGAPKGLHSNGCQSFHETNNELNALKPLSLNNVENHRKPGVHNISRFVPEIGATPSMVMVHAYTETKKHVLLRIIGDQALQFMALMKPNSRTPLPGIKIHSGQTYIVKHDVEIITRGIPGMKDSETKSSAMTESVCINGKHSGLRQTSVTRTDPPTPTTSTNVANFDENLSNECSANSTQIPTIVFSAFDSLQQCVLFKVVGKEAIPLLDQIKSLLRPNSMFFMTNARIRFSNQTFSVAAETEVFTKGVPGAPDSDSLLADQEEGKVVFSIKETSSTVAVDTAQRISSDTQTEAVSLLSDGANSMKDSTNIMNISSPMQTESGNIANQRLTEPCNSNDECSPASTLAVSAFNVEKNERVIIRISGYAAMQIRKHIKPNALKPAARFTAIELLHCGQTYIVTPENKTLTDDDPIPRNSQCNTVSQKPYRVNTSDLTGSSNFAEKTLRTEVVSNNSSLGSFGIIQPC